MIKKYCDRCGKEIFYTPECLNYQTQRKGGTIEFDIYRRSLMSGEPMKKIDLCSDCNLKLKQTIEEFLDGIMIHECCGEGAE